MSLLSCRSFLSFSSSPLKDIQKSVKRIGSGELDHRISIKKNDEFGELSKEINAMTDDIENMLDNALNSLVLKLLCLPVIAP
ncbi:MAG TPA: HAMP domain-containing protein [Leucothrix sp.]|nr:HAMP domain-containing protein [Leucothrix sp.]